MTEVQLLEYKDVRINVPWGYIVGRWYGNRNVRPILALHGWQDNLGTWDRLVPLLPRHIGIMCIDLPGHGRSSKYPKGITYHVIDYMHIIIRVMKEYQWHKVSLMGHSLGGIICFMYASLYPHTVDMLIQIDIIKTPLRSSDYAIKKYALHTEKLIIENDRLASLNKHEPPSYSYEQLEDVLYNGSAKTLYKENCKYILKRSVTKSELYPEKYYFSRDGKIKYYFEFYMPHGLAIEMVKRLKNINYLVIKSSNSNYIADDSLDLINILRKNNPNFNIYELDGTHYIHLNNPHEVAAAVVPFILRHRPATLEKWTVDDVKDKSDANKRKPNSKL